MNDDEEDLEQEYEQESEVEDYGEDIQNISEDIKKLREHSKEIQNGGGKSSLSSNASKGAKEGAKEASKQGAKEGVKEGTKETAKQGANQAGKEVGKETGKEVAKQGAKEAGKQGAKTAAKVGASAAAKSGATAAGVATGPVGWVVLAASLVVDLAKHLKKRIQKRKNEPTDKKVKRLIRENFIILLILGMVILIPAGIVFLLSAGVTVTTDDSVERIDEFVTCMQTDEKCKEITGLSLDEDVEGYDKPLVLFKASEYKDLATEYLKFSNKYFEYGEGLEFEDAFKITEDFGLGNMEGQEAEKEIDSALLAVFFQLQARVFSSITWHVESADPDKPEHRILDKNNPDDFDTLYDSSKDDGGSIFNKWLKYFDPNAAPYKIQIPKVDKYDRTKKVIQCLQYKLDSTTTYSDGKTSTFNVNGCNDSGESVVEWWPSKVYSGEKLEKYKVERLKQYISMLSQFLPEWFEPYSMFMATGDVSYAKKFYNKYISEEKDSIHVYLYYEEIEVETASKSKSRQSFTTPAPDSRSGVTVSNTESAKRTTDFYYRPVVDSGLRLTSILTKSDYYYKREEGDPAYQKEDKSQVDRHYPNGDYVIFFKEKRKF